MRLRLIYPPGLTSLGLGMIANADTGVALTWGLDFLQGEVSFPTQYGMAITTGTSVSILNGPILPGQDVQNGTTPVIPVLQAQDGSFVGSVTFVNDGVGQTNMVAFDQGGNVLWMVPNEQPLIATADGGVIGRSGIMYDENGNVTGQIAHLPTYSWVGHAYQLGSVDHLASLWIFVASSFWAFQGGNPSGTGTSVESPWFPPLPDSARQAIYNALNDLIARLRTSGVSSDAQTYVFNKLNAVGIRDQNGNPLSTQTLIAYLTATTPRFFDGTKSNYCYNSLNPFQPNSVCDPKSSILFNIPFIGPSLAATFTGPSVAGYFQMYSAPPTEVDIITATPSTAPPIKPLTPMLSFFRPSYILTDFNGLNIGNEASLFHEALHGLLGIQDLNLASYLGQTLPSCYITTWIINQVLYDPSNLPYDMAAQSCP